MNRVRDLHTESMKLAQLALISRNQGDFQRAEELARQALGFEIEAANLIPYSEVSEPTRSILFRSAASLAIQCNEFDLALNLVAKGLSGYPQEEIKQELKNLYDQANFEYHLQLRNMKLEDEDFQLSMAGTSVGSGTVLFSEFIRRVNNINKLIEGTVQRLMGRVYQPAGRISQIYKPFTPALSIPRVGSFEITFKLLRAKDQQLNLFVDAAGVIDEIFKGIELINRENEEALQQQIMNDSYYRQFLSLTRDMAPDGERINFVGFTSTRRVVSLTRQKDKIELLPKTMTTLSEIERGTIKITGVLDYASARKQDIIGLTTEDKKEYEVLVQEGMDDYVRSYFRQIVSVSGQYDGKYIYLSDIEALE